jgi:hypothetical protein
MVSQLYWIPKLDEHRLITEVVIIFITLIDSDRFIDPLVLSTERVSIKAFMIYRLTASVV